MESKSPSLYHIIPPLNSVLNQLKSVDHALKPYLCKIHFNIILQSISRSSKFLFCEISSSHGGEYDVQSCLLGCTAV
jgi:hypothetical protein